MMSRFLETIKLKDGVFYNLPYHQARLERTLQAMQRGAFHLTDVLAEVPEHPRAGLFKCRIVYSTDVEQIEFILYEFRPKRKVGIVKDDTIEYPFKFANREQLEQAIAGTDWDDAVIVKNGFVTDALYSNLVFEADEELFTPRTYLLPGTKRQFLLDSGKIRETSITLDDIHHFQKIRFINAMIDLEDDVHIETKDLLLF